MKAYKKIYKIITVAIFLVIGGVFAISHHKKSLDIQELQDRHRAVQMYRDGVWKGRYEGNFENYATGERSIQLSIDVWKDMTREDMASILDYYEMVWNAQYLGNTYVGERKEDFTGYAVFFREGTDEEILRMKFFNGQEAEITEEDQPYFPLPYMRSEEGETGLWL